MIFSRAWGYAVRALLYLDEHRRDGLILSSVIAEKESIPGPFLVKILGLLSAAGIVESARGRKGGFSLKVDLEKITLYDVLKVLEPQNAFETCILGYGKCQDNSRCPIHKQWTDPKRAIERFLKTTTLADIQRAAPIRKDFSSGD